MQQEAGVWCSEREMSRSGRSVTGNVGLSNESLKGADVLSAPDVCGATVGISGDFHRACLNLLSPR